MLLLLLPPLLQTHRTAVLMSMTGYFAGQSSAVVEILQSSAPYFLIFVLAVCSPLLLLSGRTTGYFAGQSTAVFEILQSSALYFLIFVLVVCSPLQLLSGRTTGCFAGQSTAVVEILQSSAPGLVMVMMMIGNAAVAATATAANTQNSGTHEDDRLLCWPVYCCC